MSEYIDPEGRVRLDALGPNEMREGATPAVILPPMPLRLLLENEGIDPDKVSELTIECSWWHQPKISFKYRDEIKRVYVTITKEVAEGEHEPAYYMVRDRDGSEGRRRFQLLNDAKGVARMLGGEGTTIVAYNKHGKIVWERKARW